MLQHPCLRLAGLTSAIALVVTGLTTAVVPMPAANAQSLKITKALPVSVAKTLGTRYSVPSGAIFVATTGSDSNAGTQKAPYATLAKAIKSVKQGGTIVVRGGVYRQGASAASAYKLGGTYYFTNLPSGVTIQSYANETVWFDGTQRVTKWKKVSKNHYKVTWSTPDFCSQRYYTRKPSSQAKDGPCSYPDSIGGKASLGDPQMVFRNGKQLTQVSSLKKMTSASKFYYDWSKKVMHIKFNPAGDKVELTKFAQAMALYKPTDFSIKGIGFRRYATNQIHNATAGAVLLNLGSNVLIENSVFTENAGNGLQSWQTIDLTIRKSILSSNGANGLNYDGNWVARGAGTSPADNLLIEYSKLERNNLDRYGVNCTWSCGAAGAKVTGTYGIELRYNSFSLNAGGRGTGFWCDLGCVKLKAYGNVFKGNHRHGLIYEISDDAVIASNLFVKNGWNSPAHGGGYALYIGSANVRMYNNTLVNNQQGVSIYDDARSAISNTGGYDPHRIGPSTVNTEFVNNVVTGGNSKNGRQLAVSGANVSIAGNTAAAAMIKKIAGNSYHRPTGGSKYWLVWTEAHGQKSVPFTSVAKVNAAKGVEAGSVLSTTKADPYLANAAKGDYRVRTASSAKGSSLSLPADIAALLGVPATGHDRGVIKLVS